MLNIVFLVILSVTVVVSDGCAIGSALPILGNFRVWCVDNVLPDTLTLYFYVSISISLSRKLLLVETGCSSALAAT